MACLQPPCLSSIKTKLSTPKPTLFPRTHSLKPFKISSSADQNPVGAAVEDGEEGAPKIPEAVRIAMEKAREYKKNKGLIGATAAGGSEKFGEGQVISEVGLDPVDDSEGTKKVPDAVLVAMERAKEYKKKKGLVSEATTGLKGGNLGNGFVKTPVTKKADPPISSIDFLGLNFADKRSDKLPAGLVPVEDLFPDDYFPEVELIVGDPSKFGNQTTQKPVEQIKEEGVEELYAPKVSTWGVFPRPKDISKAYGGGRTIRPGDVIETEEQRIAKNERTKRLIEEYRRKAAYTVDPKIKAECEKALEDGDSLMDAGNLKAALPYYQKVIDEMPYPTELHGLAALQWSICQDSVLRHKEARIMYEKLRNHPTPEVSKKAKQFASTFQAVEFLKVSESNFPSMYPDYQKYFNAFVSDVPYYVRPEGEPEEDAFTQALPYIIFMVSPILMVLLLAIQKQHVY